MMTIRELVDTYGVVLQGDRIVIKEINDDDVPVDVMSFSEGIYLDQLGDYAEGEIRFIYPIDNDLIIEIR